MKSHRLIVLAVTVASAVAGFSCRFRDNNGGDGTPPDGNGTPAELTETQQKAVDSVATQLEATGRALAGIADSFEGVDAEGDVNVGQCPMIDGQLADGVLTLSVEFPAGCSNEYYDDIVVSGGITILFDISARTLEVIYDDLTNDDEVITGTLSVTLSRDGTRRTLTGTIDVVVSSAGSVDGDLQVEYETAAGRMTVQQADLTLTDPDDVSHAVDVTGLVLAPVENSSFIPESGTVTFTVPSDAPGGEPVTILLEFDGQSPIDGTVTVTVNDLPPIEYTLPSSG